MDTDKRSAVESGEKKIHLACTVYKLLTSLDKLDFFYLVYESKPYKLEENLENK